MRFVCVAVILALAPAVSLGDLVFDFTDPVGMGGTAGEAFEAGNSFTLSGVTLTHSTVGGAFSAVTAQAGVGDNEIIDAGEILTLTFSGAPFELRSLDFNRVGTAADSAVVQILGVTYELQTGSAGFNGSTDLWTLPTPILLNDGDTIQFTADDEIGLQAMTGVAVPEPGSCILAGMLCFLVGPTRRRRPSR